mgnify:CR=1 FL=1
MKSLTLFLSFVAVFTIQFFSAQKTYSDWRNMNPDERKELINKMSPDEKVNLLKQFRENLLVDDLDVPENNQEEFRQLYNEYQESQKAIKSRFQISKDYDHLSDAEANAQLMQSFEVGQLLLDNRRKYAEKFQKFLKPQQILKMFQNEGMMRDKMMTKRMQDENNPRKRRFEADDTEDDNMARQNNHMRNGFPTPPNNGNNNSPRNGGMSRPKLEESGSGNTARPNNSSPRNNSGNPQPRFR